MNLRVNALISFKEKISLSSHRLTQAILVAMVSTPLMMTSAWAQNSEEHGHGVTTLDKVQVTASPLQGSAESVAKPIDVLYGEALDRQKAATLGDTLTKLPGVQTSYFGPGVGRPIIRGQDGPRVQILSSGIGTMDASTVSADHATSVEPFLADQIEVLKGPATLLFGSGAIGGAVNVVDGRLATQLPDRPLSGRAEIRGNTVNQEKTGMFRLDGVNGNWVIHFDGLYRDTNDYKIPAPALLDDQIHNENNTGRLNNSSIQTRSGGVSATWLGERGNVGISASTYRSNYGIPDGAHIHSDEHEHSEGDHSDPHSHDLPLEDEGQVRIDLVQNRFDLKTAIFQPFSFLESINLRTAYNDYQHVELEDGQPATQFKNKGYEGRLEAVQIEHNDWRGAFGLQFGQSDFSAIGDEAFVPSTETKTLGLFVLQEKKWGDWKLEVGGRYDQVKLSPEDANSNKTFHAMNLSAATIWQVHDNVDIRLGLDRSERAPTNEELFANGAHVATRSYEVGNNQLNTEKSYRAELGFHAHNDWVDVKAAIYRSQFKDFIYLAESGIEEENLPLRIWTQSDAIFTGAEAEATFHLAENSSGLWDTRIFSDYVKAELDGNGNKSVDINIAHGDHLHSNTVEIAQTGYLPRISPARVGVDLNWSLDNWTGSVGAIRYFSQNKVAQNELPSPAYTLLNAHFSYRFNRSENNSWEVFLDGSNLGNKAIRSHTSLLRDYALLPGRSIAFGLRAYF